MRWKIYFTDYRQAERKHRITRMAAAPSTVELRRRAEKLAAGYPALQAEAERVAAVVAQGVHGRRRPGQGETFWQYRNYQPSDSANQIDWRRSARGDQVYIRENEWDF